jgi:hypothetical protein
MKHFFGSALAILMAAGLLFTPCCKSSSSAQNLNQSDINRISLATFTLAGQALGQSVTAGVLHAAPLPLNQPAGAPQEMISHQIDWTGTGQWAGIAVQGTAQFDSTALTYTFNGTLTMTNVNIGPYMDPPEPNVTSSGTWTLTSSGAIASGQLSSQATGTANVTSDGQAYTIQYAVTFQLAAGNLTFSGTATVNGQTYSIRYP